MAFDPNVPNASQSPNLFPAQNAGNFTQLKKIINKDHLFNDSPQDTDGVHKQMTLIDRALAAPIDIPTGTNALLYSWLDTFGKSQLRYYNGDRDFQLSPVEVIAAVNFQGDTSSVPNSMQNIFSQFNVSEVRRIGSDLGRYLITFTNPYPNDIYIVQVTGKGSNTRVVCGAVDGTVLAPVAMTKTNCRVAFSSSGSSNREDVSRGFVVIYSVTGITTP